MSHHPPVSAYFYISPTNKVRIIGELRPKSKFLGNSVSTVMEGENRVFLMGKPEDGGESAYNAMRSSHINCFRIRVRDYDAKHVCKRNPVWEDGIRVRRYVCCKERENEHEL